MSSDLFVVCFFLMCFHECQRNSGLSCNTNVQNTRFSIVNEYYACVRNTKITRKKHIGAVKTSKYLPFMNSTNSTNSRITDGEIRFVNNTQHAKRKHQIFIEQFVIWEPNITV